MFSCRWILHVSLNNFVTRLYLINLRGVFLSSGQRCQKCVYIFKMTSNGRADIQNDGRCSDTRGHFSNVNTLFASLATWSKKKKKQKKKTSLRFLKDGLATKLLRETCKRGLILKHRYLVTLRVQCSWNIPYPETVVCRMLWAETVVWRQLSISTLKTPYWHFMQL